MEIKNLDELKELVKMIKKPLETQIEHPEKSIPDHTAQIWYYIGKGEKIHAIKMMRLKTHLSIKEAKEKIDKMMESICCFPF